VQWSLYAPNFLENEDESRIVAKDTEHRQDEKRYFCFGSIENEIITVRFVYRNNKIKIFGAGY
jgi:uncharacterized DUF497 family protein